MKILHLDIETAPNLVYAWGLFNQNILPINVVKPSHILCWAAKWHGEKKVHFASIHKDGDRSMMEKMHKLLSEADMVVHYNGDRFDIPKINQEFQRLGMKPPSPYKSVDLYKVVRKTFSLPSNKLEYVVKYFNIGEKVKNSGMELWISCMNGCKKSWELMREYNMGDVDLLEKTYLKVLPWIKSHPNHAMHGGPSKCCPNCGSLKIQKRGIQVAEGHQYQRLQCQDCGKWMRERKNSTPKGHESYKG